MSSRRGFRRLGHRQLFPTRRPGAKPPVVAWFGRTRGLRGIQAAHAPRRPGSSPSSRRPRSSIGSLTHRRPRTGARSPPAGAPPTRHAAYRRHPRADPLMPSRAPAHRVGAARRARRARPGCWITRRGADPSRGRSPDTPTPGPERSSPRPRPLVGPSRARIRSILTRPRLNFLS